MYMQIKKIVSLCFFTLTVLPYAAYADINIVNNTDSEGTAKLNVVGCSSARLGDAGIVKPHSTYPVPGAMINSFCYFDCDVSIYASNNCSGRVIATVTLNASDGVKGGSIRNYDLTRFHVWGGGSQVTIDPVPEPSFVERIKRMFF